MNKKPSDTREKILATAEQLIYQNGIHAMGMDLLVKSSGVARKSIYRHFANKEDVASAALNERDERWMQWFRTESDKGETPQERILNMFTVLKSWFESEASGAVPLSTRPEKWEIRTILFARLRKCISRNCWITRSNSAGS
jgi:AcrR family transcriptional regulator